jgi:hypothetical protein
LESIDYANVPLFAYNNAISKQFKAMRAIEDSDLNPKEKKQQMDAIQREINDLYKQAVKKFGKLRSECYFYIE